MKTPRNLNADDLIKLLHKKYGYEVVRQTGSHLRLTTNLNGENHITVPYHSPIKIGTLNNIISEVSLHFNKSKEDVMLNLFS